jgi:hypothetical protein
MKTKLLLITLLFLMAFYSSHAQSDFQYDYDGAGNRTQRSLIIPRYASPEDSVKLIVTGSIAGYQVKLFPNPTHGAITLQVIGFENTEHSKAEVYDMQGRLVLSTPLLSGFTTIDLTPQLSGNYLLSIFVDGKRKQWKVVKTQ